MAGGNSGHSFLRQILARFAVPWRDGVLPNTGQGEIDFNPPAPWGRDLVAVDEIPDQIDFNPPAPWGRDPALPSFGDKVRTYFNPPALWGAGPIIKNRLFPLKEFQSTRPVGGGTAIMHKICFAHFCNLHNHATVRVLRQAMTAAAAPSGPDSASIFRCEPFGIFLTASASHRQIIRTPSA